MGSTRIEIWVVRAFNENLPLSDFIRWQIAGDLLPDATLEQRLATGFVRLNPSTGEGGAIPEEFQMKNNFDRVETLGTVFLGLSLTCARCHTHKYDPIEQTEYYRLLAFFQQHGRTGDGWQFLHLWSGGARAGGSARMAALAECSEAADALLNRWQSQDAVRYRCGARLRRAMWILDDDELADLQAASQCRVGFAPRGSRSR